MTSVFCAPKVLVNVVGVADEVLVAVVLEFEVLVQQGSVMG